MRYLVLSDIHANAPALEAVLNSAPDNLPIWFLGDAVGYYPDCEVVLDRLAGLQQAGRLLVWMKGNHDEAVIAPTIDGMDLSPIARATISLTRRQLSKHHRALLSRLSAEHLWNGQRDIVMTHASPVDLLWDYLETTAGAALAAQHLLQRQQIVRLCLVGHTHVPLKFASDTPQVRASWQKQPLFATQHDTFTYGEHLVFLNPGSVGQPRDGMGYPHATYAILDTDARTFAVKRVRYEHETLKQRTRAWLGSELNDRSLIDNYIERLDQGI